MVADHLARAAEIGDRRRPRAVGARRRFATRAHEALETAGDVAAGLYSNQEALTQYKAALQLDGDDDCDHPDARARIAEKYGDVALRLGRVDKAVDLWERCLDYHRGEEDLARVGRPSPKDRRGPLEQGRPRGLDQPLPARHRPLEGRPAVPRAGAPLRGGRLALHAHRRQHAGDLRLGEGASPGRAPRGGGRGKPRARHLRPRLRADRRHRARPREPRALGRAGARLRPLRGDPRPARPRLPLRGLRGRLRRRDRGLRRGTRRSPSEIGDLPSQVELHFSLSLLAFHCGKWDEVETGTETVAALVEREGLTGKLCFPHLLRGALRWRDGDLEGSERSLRRAAEMAAQVGRSEIAFQALLALAATLRDGESYADADGVLAAALDTCERAGLVAQSIEATAARSVNATLWGRAEQAASPCRRGHRPRRAPSLPGRLRRGARGARRWPPATPRSSREAAEAWRELGRPLEAERVAAPRPEAPSARISVEPVCYECLLTKCSIQIHKQTAVPAHPLRSRSSFAGSRARAPRASSCPPSAADAGDNDGRRRLRLPASRRSMSTATASAPAVATTARTSSPSAAASWSPRTTARCRWPSTTEAATATSWSSTSKGSDVDLLYAHMQDKRERRQGRQGDRRREGRRGRRDAATPPAATSTSRCTRRRLLGRRPRRCARSPST